jgi:hypothetical protein
MDRLAQRYMKRERFQFPRDGQTLVRVTENQISGNDPWVGRL